MSVSIALSTLFIASVSTSQSAHAEGCSCHSDALYTIDIDTLNDSHPQQLTLKANDAYYQLVNDKGVVIQDKLYDIHAYEDGRIIAKRNGFFGAINADGAVVLDFKYDGIKALDKGFYQLSKNFGSKVATAIATDAGKWLYPASQRFDKNTQADYLYTDTLNQITYFSITKNDKHGLMTNKAQTMIAPIYDELSLLDTCPNERLFMKAVMGDKTGLIDQYQKVVVPFAKNTVIENFNEDKQIFSVMTYKNKPDDNDYNNEGLISEKLVTGKGVFVIASESRIIPLEGNLYQYEKAGKYGIINDKGDAVLPANFDAISNGYNEPIVVMQNQKTGVLTKHKDGSLNVDAFYDHLEPYYGSTYTLSEIENQAVAEEAHDYDSADYEEVADATEETDDTTEAIHYDPEVQRYIAQRNRKVGMVDSNHDVLVPFIYDELVKFDHFIRVKKDQKYGLITDKNDIVKPPIYDDIISLDDAYGDSFGMVFTKGDQQQLVDQFAHPITEFSDYRFVSDKLNSLKDMTVIEKEGKYGLFSYKDKKVTVPPIYEDMSGQVYNDTILAQLAGKTVLIDTSGKLLIKNLSQYAYTYRSDDSDKIAVVTKDDKYGLIDYTGKIVINPIYDALDLLELYDNYTDLWSGDTTEQARYIVETDGKYGIFDGSGKRIVPIEYTHISSLPYPAALIVSKDNVDDENDSATDSMHFGVLDPAGKLVLEMKYDKIFSNYNYPNDRFYAINIRENSVDAYDKSFHLLETQNLTTFKANNEWYDE
ncbi:hypothetical protein GCM10009129_09850 [Psychrobacter aestuarii]|uniref:WG repeat-containing protein n=1 Tax=Psychrobacter aestuarii TaxID=556327 RepID=A0ABN0VQG4_9GAMM